MFLLNTFLGFLTIQIADVLTRSKSSKASPEKRSWDFFWKDNWLKIVLSLALSTVLSLSAYLNLDELISNLVEGSDYNNAYSFGIYWAIGAAPEYILQKLKKNLGITQPERVITKDGQKYERL